MLERNGSVGDVDTGTAVVVQITIEVDKRRSIVVLIGIIRYVLVRRIIAIIFSVTSDRSTLDGFINSVVLLKLDPSIEHRNRSATKVGSYKYTSGNVLSLLFILIYVIIVYPVVEKNVVYIVDTADPPLLRELAESVLIYKDLLVLLTRYILANACYLQQGF